MRAYVRVYMAVEGKFSLSLRVITKHLPLEFKLRSSLVNSSTKSIFSYCLCSLSFVLPALNATTVSRSYYYTSSNSINRRITVERYILSI